MISNIVLTVIVPVIFLMALLVAVIVPVIFLEECRRTMLKFHRLPGVKEADHNAFFGLVRMQLSRTKDDGVKLVVGRDNQMSLTWWPSVSKQ